MATGLAQIDRDREIQERLRQSVSAFVSRQGSTITPTSTNLSSGLLPLRNAVALPFFLAVSPGSTKTLSALCSRVAAIVARSLLFPTSLLSKLERNSAIMGNPTYFTVGNLVQHLQSLEKRGLSRQQILDNYIFFTAGSCGPCRFGMYEAEYRFALKNAGFDGFRVLLFKDSNGIKAASGEPGLKFASILALACSTPCISAT